MFNFWQNLKLIWKYKYCTSQEVEILFKLVLFVFWNYGIKIKILFTKWLTKRTIVHVLWKDKCRVIIETIYGPKILTIYMIAGQIGNHEIMTLTRYQNTWFIWLSNYLNFCKNKFPKVSWSFRLILEELLSVLLKCCCSQKLGIQNWANTCMGHKSPDLNVLALYMIQFEFLMSPFVCSIFLESQTGKGQIISECPYEKIVCPKIATKKFPRFLS